MLKDPLEPATQLGPAESAVSLMGLVMSLSPQGW